MNVRMTDSKLVGLLVVLVLVLVLVVVLVVVIRYKCFSCKTQAVIFLTMKNTDAMA
jgi:hypothetical protein